LKGYHTVEPKSLVEMPDKRLFQQWCAKRAIEDEKCVTRIYPSAGDCVLFFSHLPHRGVKVNKDMERSNVVVNYQVSPMYPTIWHVSWPIKHSSAGEAIKKVADGSEEKEETTKDGKLDDKKQEDVDNDHSPSKLLFPFLSRAVDYNTYTN